MTRLISKSRVFRFSNFSLTFWFLNRTIFVIFLSPVIVYKKKNILKNHLRNIALPFNKQNSSSYFATHKCESTLKVHLEEPTRIYELECIIYVFVFVILAYECSSCGGDISCNLTLSYNQQNNITLQLIFASRLLRFT